MDSDATELLLVLRHLWCLAVTAAVVGLQRGMELGVSDHEFEVVTQASDNSDRFYRLVAMNVGSRKEDAARAALAFRSVAQAWLHSRTDAALAAAGISFCDVIALVRHGLCSLA